MKTVKHIIFTGILLFISIGAIPNSFAKLEKHGQSSHWGYEGEIGPDRWGDIKPEFFMCKAGKRQSPINITETVKTKLDSIKFNYHATPLCIVNNGHTIQINYKKGSSIFIGGKKYDLVQFHFHSPSEHKINGNASDMAAHLVHKSNDGKLVVIAVLMKEGDENEFMKTLWNNFPKREGKNHTIKNVTINVDKLLPKDKNYYNYTGSLTTPPCSEDVNWFILKMPVKISKEQIAKFTSVFKNNARPVQPLNGRIVKESY